MTIIGCAFAPPVSSYSIFAATNAVFTSSINTRASTKISSFRSCYNTRHTLKASSSLFSSISSSKDDSDENDIEKWQTMYEGNAPKDNKMKSFFNSYSSSKPNPTTSAASKMSSTTKSEIKVVSFDLDNTIWKTGPVIQSANDALNTYLLENIGIDNMPIRVEGVMKDLFVNNKKKYCPVQHAEEEEKIQKELLLSSASSFSSNPSSINAVGKETDEQNTNVVNKPLLQNVKAPVLLTQLRIDAIKEIFYNQTAASSSSISISIEEQIESSAQEAFAVWTQARHDAIPKNLASSVLECLNELRSLQTSNGNKIIIGAITDGNSNPTKVELLKEYFDFCINAESVGISKPDRRVYDKAILHVFENPDLQHVFDLDDMEQKINSSTVTFHHMPWWVHIGDDFVKDIVAAKDLKMRSIWCRELIKPKPKKEESVVHSDNLQKKVDSTSKEERNIDDLKKDLAVKKELNMIIGSEDFLLDSIQAEFADAIVDQFQDISRIITKWHSEGVNESLNDDQNMKNLVAISEAREAVIEDVNDVSNGISSEENDDEKSAQTTANEKVKFCIMCGTKLPIMANFCSSCGQKQNMT